MNTVQDLLEELKELVGLIDEASTAAFEKPAGIARSEDQPVVKHGNDHSDPTGDAVVNPERLVLSSRLDHSLRVIDEATRHIRGARKLLENGLDSWAGVSDD